MVIWSRAWRSVTRGQGSGLNVLDTALVHFECGREGVQLARHVLGLAHVTLADVPSGADETGDSTENDQGPGSQD